MKFRDVFIAETTVDPYLTSSTIAAACNVTYRKNYLKKDAIGVVPVLGYRSVSLFCVLSKI